MNTIKISLAAARVNAGLTQADVANKLHKTRQTIVNWEKGKQIPDFRTLYTLSGLYGIPMDAFFLPSEST